ncbi:MAG: carbohydrate kinase [Acidobacteriota bacterium]
MSRPWVFGEVVFDVFPDGREVLGGAPFNVAWHLHGLGCNPLLLTRVGRDRRGEEVLARMAEVGMDTTGVQVDSERPTGVVRVELEDGQPRFSIAEGVAWDAIEFPPAPEKDEKAPAWLVAGSLALQGSVNRRTLAQILETYQPRLFVDVNLRPPWFTRPTLDWLLAQAAWVKLNREEAAQLGWEVGAEGANLPELCKRFGLEGIALTLGDGGAVLATPQRRVRVEPVPVEGLVDTVGAGDAFTAVLVLGLLRGSPWERSGAAAALLASRICSIRGAVPAEQGWYREVARLLDSS